MPPPLLQVFTQMKAAQLAFPDHPHLQLPPNTLSHSALSDMLNYALVSLTAVSLPGHLQLCTGVLAISLTALSPCIYNDRGHIMGAPKRMKEYLYRISPIVPYVLYSEECILGGGTAWAKTENRKVSNWPHQA